MKTIAYTLVFVLFVLSLATPRFASAHAAGPSANGTYRFVMEDGLAKSVEFEAQSDERGATTGTMTLVRKLSRMARLSLPMISFSAGS